MGLSDYTDQKKKEVFICVQHLNEHLVVTMSQLRCKICILEVKKTYLEVGIVIVYDSRIVNIGGT